MVKRLFLALALFPSLLLFGAEDYDEINFYEAAASFRAFGLNGTYLNVQPATFRTEDLPGKYLRYIQSDAAFSYTYPCTPEYGFILGAGWVGTEVDMQNNPQFDETNFNYVTFSLGGFSSSWCHWLWTATFSMLLDTQQINLSEYALYQGVLWGKYTLNPSLEFDIGVIAEIGLNKEKVWPIIGFIYNYNSCLSLHAVFPLDMTLQYDMYDWLTIAGSIRFLRNRHRVSDDNPNPQAIFEYRTTGVEFDLTYTPFEYLSVKGFVGSTLNGDFKVTNKNNHHAVHYKFNGSMYAGITGQVSY
jgi:hypothetical protein